jgi:hypothetical protein
VGAGWAERFHQAEGTFPGGGLVCASISGKTTQMNEAQSHIAAVWPIITAAVIGLVAIVGTTIASLGYIRRQMDEVAGTVASRIKASIDIDMVKLTSQVNAWDSWRISFHQSVKDLRNDVQNVVARQARLEEVARQASEEVEKLEGKIDSQLLQQALRNHSERE